MTTDASMLSDAVVAWTGWGTTSWPQRDETRVAERFGAAVAADLIPRVRELEADFYASDAAFTIAGLSQLGAVAAGQFRSKHPEISEAAVRALTWCYTYDYR